MLSHVTGHRHCTRAPAHTCREALAAGQGRAFLERGTETVLVHTDGAAGCVGVEKEKIVETVGIFLQDVPRSGSGPFLQGAPKPATSLPLET